VLESLGYSSQLGQDLFLDRHVFAELSGGVVVDVGAHDGVTFSNSVFFERARGWTAVCIEPNPTVFAALQENRPDAACVQSAIGAAAGSAEFTAITGYGEMLSGLTDRLGSRHNARIDRDISRHGGSKTTIEVEVRRLDSILREHGIRKVDLLTIDVEGGEDSLRLAIRLDVIGDRIHADFTGTSPVLNMGINVPIGYSKAFVVYAVKCVTTPAIPNNIGCVTPITVSAPDNCILNALPPYPTGGRHVIGHFVNPLTMGALAQIVPDKVQAESGMMSLVNIQGRHRDGRGVSSIYFSSGGFGALKGIDGLPTMPSPSNMTGTPVEVWEDITGMSVRRKALLANSGGPGEFRGGLGQVIELVNDTGNELTISCLSGRTQFAAQGLAGGQPGALRACLINGTAVHPKGRYFLKPGDVLTLVEPGGGGFGPAEKRAPARLADDMREGFVTLEAARRDYGFSG